jgi:hypothetical protein
MADTELLPCPWCGETPDVSNDASFRLTDGVKYGALQCCVVGPEVRTDYKDVPHWREAAIAAWNDRKTLASRPAEVDDKIPRESNDALIALAKYWKLDGDWMTCKGCRRSLIASRDGEELAHGDGCKYWDQQHPWTQLRKLIAQRPAPSHTTNKENGGPDGSVPNR